jgi:hypothetical protein
VTDTWPKGTTPVPIETLLTAARRLEHDGRAGKPVDRALLRRMSRTLDGYVASLPLELQDATAQRLLAAIETPPGPAKAVAAPAMGGRRVVTAGRV